MNSSHKTNNENNLKITRNPPPPNNLKYIDDIYGVISSIIG